MAVTINTDDANAKRAAVPPYIAFQTLKTLLADSKEHGVPGRIDKTVLTRFSGGVGSQLIAALRFLELIDGFGTPTPRFRTLVESYGTDQWSITLSDLITERYQPIVGLDLQAATPGQFSSIFRSSYPATDETQRKCMTFFLNAAREAGISISPYILKGTKPRAPLVRRRASPSRPGPTPLKKSLSDLDQTVGEFFHKPEPTKSAEQMLLDLLNPAAMSPEEQQAVWTLLLYLKSKI